ncbi:MAG: phosphotransferase family protein [Myxococcota bacterium]
MGVSMTGSHYHAASGVAIGVDRRSCVTSAGGRQTMDETDETDALPARLVAWLATRLPDARDLRISGLRKPGAGLSSDTQLFTIHWRDAAGTGASATGAEQRLDAVLRCAPRSDGPFPEYDLAMQFGIMRQLGAHTTVPVPEVLWQEEDPSWLGVPFLTMKAVEGEPPLDWPAYHASGFYADMKEAERRRLWRATIDAVAKLHAVDWRAVGLDFVPGGRPGDDPQRHLLQYWRRYLDAWIKDDPKEVIPVYDEALDWLERNRPECPRPTLVWGDAKLGNVLYRVASGEVAAVIDWEIAMIGDPQVDLASLQISDLRAQQSAGTCLPGTPAESELIALYERATGEKLRSWRWAMLYSAFWRGAVTIKVMRRMKAQGHAISDEMLANHFPVDLMRGLLAG